MRAFFGLAVAASAWAAPALATDWYLVANSTDKATALFVDRDSIKSSGNSMSQARVMLVFRVDNQYNVAAYDEDLEYDCGRPQYRFVNIKSYSGSATKMTDEPGTGKWLSIGSGSLDASSQDFICAGGYRTGAVKYGPAFPLAAGRSYLNGGTSSSSGSLGHGS
ncbi:MAG: surface-adhesin E family protein [Pseudomonadota bacterium]